MHTFKMKDLGHLTYFLGLQISRTKDGISVSKRKYAEDLLSFAHLMDARPFDTSLKFNVKISKDDGSLLQIQL